MNAGIVALMFCMTGVAAETDGEVEDSIKVTVLGLIRTDVVAIGGETTGATITAKGITWELDFGKNAALRKGAEKLNGKKGIVQGTLERRKGVEIRERWIVTVSGVEGVGEAGVGGIAPPRLNSTARRDDTRIRFLTHKDATVIDIASGFGIDRAVISRETDDWPKPLVVRLHLRGLESFQAMAGDITVKWSMSAIGDSPARVTLRHGSAETPLDEASPYFTEPRYFAAERGVPLKDDYFEVSLPPKVFEGNPGKVTLAWVDFFRG